MQSTICETTTSRSRKALSPIRDIDELDRVTAGLQGDGYFKVVALASLVTDFASTRAFAEQVRQRLGGDGRVLVFDTGDVGIASSVGGEADKVESAEPHYQQHEQHSAWLSNAAMTAIAILAAKGIGGAMQPRRAPSDDVWFDQHYGGGAGMGRR
jgi:hypothetical protein